MQQSAKPKLPNGKLRELSEKYNIHYMKAARMTSGQTNPTTAEDYKFLTEINLIKTELQEAKEKFLQSQQKEVA